MSDPLQAAEPRAHGIPLRGLETTPASATTTGRFGRMFRHVPIYTHRPESLVELGLAMVQGLEDGRLDEPLGAQDDDENTETSGGELRLPAGYTYFGQFVDHDITFDPASSLTMQNDPDALVDFRTPRFDLDSLYGRGPSDQPYLYVDGMKLALGDPVSANPVVGGPDLIRTSSGRAIIGDPRNDENLIVSQLQATFAQFHNAVVDRVLSDQPTLSPREVFDVAQRTVRWHYQWIVIHDFLVRLVGEDVVEDLLRPVAFKVPDGEASVLQRHGLFYGWRQQPFMPVEFSVAAYRFGHSMARPSYLINDVVPVPVVANAARIPLFSQTGGPLEDLNGFRPLPNEWGIQWKYFLGADGVPGPNDQFLPQPSYRIDAEVSNPLGALPSSVAGAEVLVAGTEQTAAQVLSVRNLLRSLRLRIPSGQDVARAMGMAPMSDDELLGGLSLTDVARTDFTGHAPLWFYVLKEAEVLAGATHLGPVGGRIVAEVLVGLLDGDPLSYLSVDPTWVPTLPSKVEGRFALADLVNLARPAPEPSPSTGTYP